MTHELIKTSDGSTSLYIPQLDETYHSVHGALQETQHVFIKNGLQLFDHQSISILEIGFGTGLNALVTYKEHKVLQLNIHYETVEAYPISWEEASQMNFSEVLSPTLSPIFEQMHCCPWDETIALLLSASKNDYNVLKLLTMSIVLTLFISMLLGRKYNQNCGKKLFSNECTLLSNEEAIW